MARAVELFPADAGVRLQCAMAFYPFHPRDALTQLRLAVELDASDPAHLAEAAMVAYELNAYPEAQHWAEQAHTIAPVDFSYNAALINLGAKLAALRGDDALAEEGLRGAVEVEPSHETLVEDLAVFLRDRGRIPEALAVLGDALPAMEPGARDRLSQLRSTLNQG